MGCLVSNGKSLDRNVDKYKHLRSTFFSDGHLHRKVFDEYWLRNVEVKLTANLHQDYVQPLSTQICEDELDNAPKESQTSKKSSDQLAYIHPCFEIYSKLPVSVSLISVYMQAPTFGI